LAGNLAENGYRSVKAGGRASAARPVAIFRPKQNIKIFAGPFFW
jgi:hypothetical protein